MWRKRTSRTDATAEEPLAAFVATIAAERGVAVSGDRVDRLVAGAVSLCRGSTADEIGLVVTLLEQLEAELRLRGR